MVLRAVERPVRHPNEPFGGVGVRGVERDPSTDREVDLRSTDALMVEERLHVYPDALRDDKSPGPARLWKNERELLAAIAAGHIDLAHARADHVC